jgi:hypothetical protein
VEEIEELVRIGASPSQVARDDLSHDRRVVLLDCRAEAAQDVQLEALDVDLDREPAVDLALEQIVSTEDLDRDLVAYVVTAFFDRESR